MTFVEALVEGESDVPTVREILTRRFGLMENERFRIHPHQGKGRLPQNPAGKPEPNRRGLLDQLPAKLRAYSSLTADFLVLVLVDADRQKCEELKKDLLAMYRSLKKRPPNVLFRIAVEETESWFLADADAIRKAYPRARMTELPKGPPDAVIGAWERLAKVLRKSTKDGSPVEKRRWAEAISRHLDLWNPRSPSLRALVQGLARYLRGNEMLAVRKLARE